MTTEMLARAFAAASDLDEMEQDALAAWILEEIADERKWDEQFARSANQVAALANDALAEFQAGQTERLDPDHL